MSRWILSIAMLMLFCVGASAQTGNIHIVQSISTDADNYQGPTGTHLYQSEYYTITQQVEVSVSLGTNQRLTATGTSGTYTFGNLSGNLNITVGNNNTVTIAPVTFTNLEVGEYEFSCNVTLAYTTTGQTGTQTISLSGTFGEVKIWPKPEATPGNLNIPAVLSGTTVNLGPIVYTGGDDEGWAVEWSTGTPGQNNTTCSFTPYNYSDAPVTYEVVATVKNFYPDKVDGNDVPWYEESFTYTIPTYAVPSANMAGFDTDYFAIETVQGEVANEGGNPDGWSYKWSNNTTGRTYSQQFTNTGATKRTETISVEVVNKAPDSDAIWFSQTFSANVDIYPNPQCKIVPSSTSNYYLNHAEIELRAEYSGGNPDNWHYWWYLDGEIQPSSMEVFKFSIDNPSSTEELHTVRLEPTNTLPNGHTYNMNEVYEFYVFGTPVMNALSSTEQSVGDGKEVNLYVGYTGGYTPGWEYTWTKNGQVLSGENAANLKFTTVNNTNQVITDTYTVRAVDKYPAYDEPLIDETTTFTVHIYPKAEFGVNQDSFDAYYDTYVTMNAFYSGGSATVGTGYWSVEWRNTPTGGNISSSTSYSTYVSYSTQLKYTETYYAYIQNRLNDGTVLYDGTFPVTINAWSRGEIYQAPLDSTDFNHTARLTLSVTPTGGYTGPYGGWAYSWRDNGNSVSNNTSSYNVNVTNTGTYSQNYSYSVDSRNTMNGTLGSDTERSWYFTVWPEIVAPTTFTVYDETTQNNNVTKVRSGNYLYLSPSPATARGGYGNSGSNQNNWNYRWTENGSTVSYGTSSSTVAYTPATGGKNTSELVYSLSLTNPGPNGTPWYSRTFSYPAITVYEAPDAPTSLVKKGNGTTHTVIAMCDINDSEIANRGIEFVFGYTAYDGAEVAMPATPERYYHFDSNYPSDNLWVYAQWTYTDGSIVTSGKRYLSGYLDTSFDGSSYSGGSRGDLGGATDILADNDTLETNGRYFRAELNNASDATVRIYNTSGNLVKVLDYPTQTSFDETIDTDNLPTGVYFVEVTVGQYRAIKKIVINSMK